MTKKALIRFSFIFGIIFIVAAVFLSVIFGGFYNVGVTNGHTKLVEWVLRTTMENSVRKHAQDIEVPDTLDLGDPTFYSRFYGHYSAACQTCHGAPGQKADPWMIIYPEAPDLTEKEIVDKWTDTELIWIRK